MRQGYFSAVIGLFFVVVLALAGTAFFFPAYGESGPSIKVEAGSGQFQLVGGEIPLEALVTRDGKPAPGRRLSSGSLPIRPSRRR